MAEITRYYSRQTAALGSESFHKVQNLHVFVSGLRGVGIECAKNLILCGVAEITIHDDSLLSEEDLHTNFFVSKADVGVKNRVQASIDGLKSLNPHVKVIAKDGKIEENFLGSFALVVYTDTSISSLIHINQFCRMKNPPIGFICCENWGMFGYMFVDFGPEFITYDKTGEENRSYYISNITRENPGIVTVFDRHYLQDGNYVVFKEVQGMDEINNTPPRPVRVVSKNSFSIEDTSGYSPYYKEGVSEHFKIPEKLRFKNLETSLIKPSFVCDNLGKAEQLHISMRAISEFVKLNGHLPTLNNESDALQVYSLAIAINSSAKESNGLFVEEVDKSFILNISLYARRQFAPISSYWGSLVSSEVIKFTGKYLPLMQWTNNEWFDLTGALQDHSELLQAFQTSKGLIVGLGALGSEVVKLCGQCGIRNLIIADKGKIKASDRHLFYSSESIGQEKAEIASQRIKEKYNNFHLEFKNSEFVDINLTDSQWKDLNWVISAVDNYETRISIDKKCVWYEKPLIDGKFNSTYGYCSVHKPMSLQSFSESTIDANKPTPLDIINNFPYHIEHCIEFAKAKFKLFFEETVIELRSFLEDPATFVTSMPEPDKYQKLQTLYRYLEIINNSSYDECIKYGKEKFVEIFYDSVQKLLTNFPGDLKEADGLHFWTGFKRIPSLVAFDTSEDIHLQFVEGFASNLAHVLGVQVVKINIKDIKERGVIRSHLLNDLQSILSAHPQGQYLENIKVSRFDVDNALHSGFIYCLSTIRARSYRILEIDRFSTEIIAGNINGCLPSTSSLVAASICVELFRLNLDHCRNLSFNLACNMMVEYEPAKAKPHKSIEYDEELCAPIKAFPEGFTVWDKLIVQGPLTVEGLITKFAQENNLVINLITFDNVCVYSSFAESKNTQNTFEELFQAQISKGLTSLCLEISCEEQNTHIEVLTPVIKYLISG